MRKPRKPEMEPAAPAEATQGAVPLGPPGPDLPVGPLAATHFPPREPGQLPDDDDTGVWLLPFDDEPL